MKSFLAVCIALLSVVVLSAPDVRAATLVSTNLNTVSVGSEMFGGSIPGADLYQQDFVGALPSMMAITFTYNLSQSPTGAPPTGSALLSSLGYTVNSPFYNISAAVSSGELPVANQSGDGLVLASASMDTLSSGQTVITNLTNGLINFKSTLVAFLLSGVSLTGTYVVSAVPLPAALPLMLVGALGLVGVSARRRKA